MAIVLADGSAGALKALDMAMVPNFVVRHEDQQLIIVHGMKSAKDPANLAPIHGAVDHINKSRVGATLNYKIEMIKLSGLEPEPPVSQTPEPPATSPGKSVAGKEKQAAPPAELVAPPPPPIDPAAEKAKEQAYTSATVASYVGERCDHHHTSNIFLGVGSGQQGKSIIIGSVAKQVLTSYRGCRNLFFMKTSGPMVRPTAAMRMLVLVVPGTDMSHLKFALSLASVDKKNDRVGVAIVINNGKPKPQEGVMMVASTDSDGLQGVGEVSRQCTALLSQHGLVDPTGNADEATSVQADSFPLINYLTLEPTSTNPTPTIDECGVQVMKYFGAFKIDFLVLPPPREGHLSDNFVNLTLAAQKPHVLIPA